MDSWISSKSLVVREMTNCLKLIGKSLINWSICTGNGHSSLLTMVKNLFIIPRFTWPGIYLHLLSSAFNCVRYFLYLYLAKNIVCRSGTVTGSFRPTFTQDHHTSACPHRQFLNALILQWLSLILSLLIANQETYFLKKFSASIISSISENGSCNKSDKASTLTIKGLFCMSANLLISAPCYSAKACNLATSKLAATSSAIM